MRSLLVDAHAFPAVYVEQVTEWIRKVGVEVKEDWSKDDHAIMLLFQFVKVFLLPIYTANFPKTEAEVDALKTLMNGSSAYNHDLRRRQAGQGTNGRFRDRTDLRRLPQLYPTARKRTLRRATLWGRLSYG